MRLWLLYKNQKIISLLLGLVFSILVMMNPTIALALPVNSPLNSVNLDLVDKSQSRYFQSLSSSSSFLNLSLTFSHNFENRFHVLSEPKVTQVVFQDHRNSIGVSSIEPDPPLEIGLAEDVMTLLETAFAAYELEDFEHAEKELRTLIRKHPMVADYRAALCALLWREGSIGEAQSNWAAVLGLDIRYKQSEWLVNSLNWPQQPTKDLMSFLHLDNQ